MAKVTHGSRHTSYRIWLDAIWREALAPELALTVSEWADRHWILPPRSAEPGPVALARVVVARAGPEHATRPL